MSRDGGKKFLPLIASTRNNTALISTDGLPGGKGVVFRVTASDGLHSAAAITRPIALKEHRPVAAITSIRNGDKFLTTDALRLRGLAFDLEEGVLGDTTASVRSFEWIADGRMLLGSGQQLVVGGRLAAGRHTITLNVTDSSGMRGSHSVSIAIERPAAAARPDVRRRWVPSLGVTRRIP
jgi:hypothetical protein